MTTTAIRWMNVSDAAEVLGLEAVSLRRALERNARRATDGAIEARIDGVVGRKFGRLWRVCLADGWLAGISGTRNT